MANYISKISLGLPPTIYELKAIPNEEYQQKIKILEDQVLADSFIMADAITGELYVIQIQNGQLGSMPVSELSSE